MKAHRKAAVLCAGAILTRQRGDALATTADPNTLIKPDAHVPHRYLLLKLHTCSIKLTCGKGAIHYAEHGVDQRDVGLFECASTYSVSEPWLAMASVVSTPRPERLRDRRMKAHHERLGLTWLE